MTTVDNNNKPQIKKMELLAPAGDFEALKAAVENGADAVYLGGRLFNARASAANFAGEELKKAIAYAHERLVKVYVTLNVLVADREFPQLADFLYELSSLGADAVIVQDIGVAHFIREVLPEMSLHASTQMTVNNSWGVRQLEKMGFSRVVLARETTAEEIAKISAQTSLELEVFGHGALCICYSGQCLMSSYIGARSGNRGRCAQPCRMAYQLVGKNGKDLLGKETGDHLLSPRDLNLSESLAEMQRAGVSSLKLEGRMKRPEYVATVVRIYRQALDALENDRPGLTAQERYELTQIFNRDFTSGYFHGYQGPEMMSFGRPNNRGTMLGRIVDVKPGRVQIKLDNKLNLGDGIEIWTGRGREGITVEQLSQQGGKKVESLSRGEIATVYFSGKARIGDRVFKTHDQELIAKAQLSYQEGKEIRKRSLKMVLSGEIGSKLRLEAFDGQEKAYAESQTEAQEAVNRPLNEDYLQQQLGRLGNTPFVLGELVMNIPDNLMIPVSELNNLRRSVTEQLLEKARANHPKRVEREEFLARYRHWQQKLKESVQAKAGNQNLPAGLYNKPQLSTAVTELKLIPALIKSGADRIIVGGEHWRFRGPINLKELEEAVEVCRKHGVQLLWRLPRIMNEEQSRQVFAELEKISRFEQRPVIMTANLAGISMLQALDPTWEWETDYFLHVFNRGTMDWIQQAGGRRTALSTELSKDQLQEMASKGPTEVLVFGDMEMMVSEFCLMGSTLGHGRENPREKCSRVCQRQEYFLKDRMAYKFPLLTDRECRMHIFNARKLNLLTELDKIAASGLKSIRLEMIRVTEDQAVKTVSIFKELWMEASAGRVIKSEKMEEALRKLEALYPEGFTKGHFYRGVLNS